MKKYLLIAMLLMTFGAVQTHAQLGLKLGYNFAKISGIDVVPGYSEKSLNNIQGGVFYEKGLIPLLGLRIGLDYSPKGSKEVKGSDYDQTTFNYLELPLLAKVKLGPMYALGGFYGAYALNGKSKFSLAGQTQNSDFDFDKSKVKRFDYGMKFGAGLQFGVGPIHIFAQADYSFGLQNISKTSGQNYKNNVIGVAAGVLLGFK